MQKMKKYRKFIVHSRKNVDDFGLRFETEERCKGVHCVDLGERFPYFLFSIVPFFSIFFSNRSSFQRVFTCKNRRRYSRERAPRSLGENSIHYSFVSLCTPAWQRAAAPDRCPTCLLYTSPSPRDQRGSRMPSSA